MKKFIIISIGVIALASFGSLVYVAYRNIRGVPVDIIQEKEKPELDVPFIKQTINLKNGIDLSFWETMPSLDIELYYQVMVLPWPKKVVPQVTVKAFRNKKDIYFYMEWEDKTIDNIQETGIFTDACAIMFPLSEDIQPSSLMMGFLGHANLWQWKADQDREFWLNERYEKKPYVDFYYPFEEEELFIVSKKKYQSAVNDLLAIRVATITHKPSQNVKGRGIYNKGVWRVVYKRSLKAADAEVDIKFSKSNKLCAFAVWDGSHRDRGGRKSISNWVQLNIEQETGNQKPGTRN